MSPAARIGRAAILLSICAAIPGLRAMRLNAQSTVASNPAPSPAQDASMDEYRNHLQALMPIVEACAKARDTKTCDPTLVGPDDRVSLGEGNKAEVRLVRYDWLRALLAKGQLKDEPPPKPDAAAKLARDLGNSPPPPPPTTSKLLEDAVPRLKQDLAQAGGTLTAAPGHGAEHGALTKVLAQREFRNLEETSVRDTILERIGNAINRFFDRVASFSARSKWIGRLVVWGFFAAVCVGLVWGLIQLERRWRLRLIPAVEAPAPGAASARDWQLWLEDARRAAAEGRWREAVHFVYWAAISRLESNRLWPADRARTPREYLALVAEADPRKAGLKSLTGSFERIWYGGRPAGEADYRAAETQAQGLIAGGGGG
jgi:hypothetical protein